MRPFSKSFNSGLSLLKILGILFICQLLWFCSGKVSTSQVTISPPPLDDQSRQQQAVSSTMGERLYLTNRQRGYKHKRCGMCHSIVDQGILHQFIEQETTRVNPFTDQPFGRIEAICTSCHTSLHLAHPVGIIPNPEKVVLPSDASGFKGEADRLTCMSCHDWHPTNNNYKYLRWPVADEYDLNRFCLHCHTGQGVEEEKLVWKSSNIQQVFQFKDSSNIYLENSRAEKGEYFKGYRGAIFNLASYAQKQTEKAKAGEIEVAKATNSATAMRRIDMPASGRRESKPVKPKDSAKPPASPPGLTEYYVARMPEGVKQDYETARDYKREGELNNATIYFRKALEAGAEFPPIYYELGETYILKGWHDEAKAMFQKAIELAPNFAPAYLGLGQLYKAKGEYSQAVEVCKTALKLKPDYGAACYQLGVLYKQQGKLDEAKQMLIKAVNSKDTPYAAAYYELGLFHKQTDPAKAKQMFYQAIKRADHAGAYYELGEIYKKDKDPAKAEQMFKQAVAAKSTDPLAYYELAALYKQRGLVDEAMTAYTQATKIDKSFAPAYYQLGIIFLENRQLADADKMLSQTTKLNPDYYEAYYQLAKVYYQQKKLPEAIRLYEKVININRDYAAAYFELGRCYRQLGKVGEGIASLKRVIELQPEHAQAHYLLGSLYEARGWKTKAGKEFKLAVKLSRTEGDSSLGEISPLNEEIATNKIITQLDPENVEAFFNLGTTYMAVGQLAEAVIAYKRAIDLKPKHWEAYYNIALAYKIQNKWPEATAALKNVIQMKPELIDAHHTLAEIFQAQGQWEAAIQEFQQVLVHKPAIINYRIAQIYYAKWQADKNKNNLIQAKGYFSQAVKYNPKNVNALNRLKDIEKLLIE